MNSALLVAAYFTMLLSPCVVAEWGDLLTFRWVPTLLRRRRTHPQESLLESFRQERYALSVAAEAALVAGNDFVETPRPFLVFKHVAPVETPAFLAARQRVAARLAQMAIARKLRDDAAAQDAADQNAAERDARERENEQEKKIVALPADVPAEQVPTLLAAAAEIASFNQSRNEFYLGADEFYAEPPVYAFQKAGSPIALVTSPPHRERTGVVPINSSRGASDPWPPGPRGGKPNESSDAVEKAA